MAGRQPAISWPAAFALPGFEPDALPFAARTTAALLLAYAIAFTAQVQPASSAGVCVAVLAQASAGMAASKALYRTAGTIIGCLASLCLLAAFPQDRTLLLMGYVAWLALCSGIATLARDFRSYGAALSGYTVAIVAIGVIDSPATGLTTAFDRSAAIGIGIGSTLVVNLLFGGNQALGKLITELGAQTRSVTSIALDVLEGRPLPDTLSLAKTAASVAALRTDATYAASEQPNGRLRDHAARFTLAALLGCLNASRGLALAPRSGASPAVTAYLRDVTAAARAGTGEVPAAPTPSTPDEALLLDRAAEILARLRDAATGLRALTDGSRWMPPTDLRLSYDVPAAFISAARTAVAVSLGACFCVLAGWPGATLLLTQQSAIVGLLGASPAPVVGASAFALTLAPAALAVGLVNYFVLPSASGFVPFALAVGPLMFGTALMVRGKKLAPYAPAALIYVTLLLSPANQEVFDLGSFLNNVLELALAVVFTFFAFLIVLPVSPKRRLYRIAVSINRDFALAQAGRSPGGAAALFLLYDRLSRAMLWIGPPKPTRTALLHHMSCLGQAKLALLRTHAALRAIRSSEPLLADAAAAAPDSLADLDPGRLHRAAADLLGRSGSSTVRRAAAGMAELALLGGLRPPLARYRHLLAG